jgi:hypothetical protein
VRAWPFIRDPRSDPFTDWVLTHLEETRGRDFVDLGLVKLFPSVFPRCLELLRCHRHPKSFGYAKRHRLR